MKNCTTGVREEVVEQKVKNWMEHLESHKSSHIINLCFKKHGIPKHLQNKYGFTNCVKMCNHQYDDQFIDDSPIDSGKIRIIVEQHKAFHTAISESQQPSFPNVYHLTSSSTIKSRISHFPFLSNIMNSNC